ncbi:hypothetical protein HYH02_014394 [Chlamydomonas schloesseri]|uniref:Era-type G domain-containing protein n=1 Tax=Chlamydomonas schloesseri TaxID=2026947 RepID=A0A835SJP1_9CHLO|nr:hypothetical protein HYH02_014394 [Chlamydomonas schloesseri]|eukprot:KAG2428378.1 hypothetical protein HYH02_014394 [Chlamydomonas schloesseri]
MHSQLTLLSRSHRLGSTTPPCATRSIAFERYQLCIRSIADNAEPQPEPSTSEPDGLRLRRRLVRPRKPTSQLQQAAAKPSSTKSDSGLAAASGPATKQRKASSKPKEQAAPAEDDEEALFFADKEKFSKPILNETSPFYQPALTDEDLAEDPPGHRSGYVAVIGKPNAGKSTLINALVGQKLSIVTYKPQTTRHRVMGILSERDYQMILFDTPGVIEKKRTKLEERMMAAVVHSIKEAEAIIAVVDSADKPKEALGMFQPGEGWNGPPMAVLLNKADLLSEEQIDELRAWYKDNCRAEEVFVGSAERKDGLGALREWAVSRLPEGPTLYSKSIVSEQPERFFVAECVREQVFLHCEQEVPYCSQVLIKEFTERRTASGQKDYISAEIVVEKESQKGIVIGAGGSMLRRIGGAARKEIEAFLGRGVYLELSVQVDKDWRDDKDALSKYGYFNPMII